MPAPVFNGDTLYAESEVLEKRESRSRPTQGIVTVQTRAHKADGTLVMTFKRTMLIPKRGHAVEDKIFGDRAARGLSAMFSPPGDADEDQMLEVIERWLERDVRPRVMELERADACAPELIEQMKAFGLFGATIAPEHGGLGLPALTYARIVARIAEVWIALPGYFNTHLIMAEIVQRFGTDPRKSASCRALRPASSGAAWHSPSPTAAPTCRQSGPAPSARVTAT